MNLDERRETTAPQNNVVLDEEDAFLREMRQLAGMDAPEPARPIGAASMGKATAQPANTEYTPTQPTRPAQPVGDSALFSQPEGAAQDEPAYPAYDDTMDDDEPLLAGWQKGLILLFSSAAMLVLTVLAVLNAI